MSRIISSSVWLFMTKSSTYTSKLRQNIPWLMMNAVFSSSSSAILIWWYPLYAFRKHLRGDPQRDYTFQSISGILLGHLGGAPLCAAGRPSYLLASRQKHPGPKIIAHSIGMTLLLRIVTVPPLTGNFNIPCAVDGTTRIFLIPVLPIIPLCWDGDMITMKFIYAEVECSSSPIFTSRDIWPIGQMVSPLNPMSDVVAGIIWLLISGRSLTKQCSYRNFVDAHRPQ
ncbi:hypothetical protein Tco_0801642 [Tanacetum coccineum]|uniref:Uncharacterized protein n=1 Tax=Tanacetum coccineum TaxID=301880 RepID=A0ABQ4ZWL0_9ASTR